MKKYFILNIIFISLTLQFFSCSNDIDNLTPPNGTIHGALLDKSTKDTVYTSNNTSGFSFPDGVLNLFQQNYSSTVAGPQGTSFTQYGTFKNTAIFHGQYKAIPVGAFYADTVLLNVSENTKIDFEVNPFLKVNINVDTKTANSITVSYSANTNSDKHSVNELAVWLGTTEGVSRFFWLGSNRELHENLNANASFTKTFQNLSPNTSYYIRAGAKASGDNPQGYWNYSKLIKIKL
ncbi:DUF3823 domain-containing protein [Sphingobacterium bovistauri]|uniref:DUF3823 domain-containing protein n=1 Tax=Sphingobacterium bovistauri TaxID=2781959 RepID=A0ABS7Z678_9SPHI|nr:DUF3823 domain-containing protein [Sphingobacterium bovistauri]MCA5005660.1 DUF3823 domain-containing protein [Sphingobacterium bovistauri]